MKVTTLVALSVPLLVSGPALAQGTAAQRIACGPDAYRLCASEFPNVSAITACMRREKANVSAGCRAAMDEAGGGSRIARDDSPRASPRMRMADGPPMRGDIEPMSSRRAPYARRLAVRDVVVPSYGRRSSQRTIIRYVYIERPPARASRQSWRSRGFASGGGRGSQMAQAMYWMQKVGAMSGGMGGMSMRNMPSSIGGMNISSLMSMMPY